MVVPGWEGAKCCPKGFPLDAGKHGPAGKAFLAAKGQLKMQITINSTTKPQRH
jgi:hypothetical protein